MAKQSKLVGLEIKEVKHLGGGLTMLIFTDGTFIVVGNLSDQISGSELDFNSEEEDSEDEEEDSEDEEEDEDSEEDEDEEEESDEDEEDEDSDDDDEEGEELTAEDLMEMDADDLEDLIDDEELDVDVEDYEDDEEGLRKEVAKALGIKLPAKGKSKKGKK